ncbi:MAG: hypothetical protein LUD19_06265 [Clostridia bacterium]|nr:hypothetical protein [Clostridia bacterium]
MKIDTNGSASKLDFFQSLYEEARSQTEENYEEMQKYYQQYLGSTQIDGSETSATQIRNITYELVESQITTYIPNPSVSAEMYSDKNERNAKNIETLLTAKRNKLPFEKLNDLDERFNPIYGGSVWLIEWDNSITTHNTVGDIKVSCLPPWRFTGQPNIYEVADMEYCFIQFETTKEDIVRKYGVTPETADEAESDEGTDDKTATLYVCYYKNEDDKVSQYIWSGNTELVDIEDYFARKRYVCKNCGKRKELCDCAKPKYELVNEDYEEIDHDIPVSDGTVIPAESVVIKDGQIVMETQQKQMVDESGMPMFDDSTGVLLPVMQTIQIPKKEPTKLPFYVPNLLPIVIRRNTSREDSLFGQSDCEFIRPQQQGVNKLESRISEKLNKSGVYAIVPDDFEGELDNSIFGRVFRANSANASLYGRIDLQVDITRDIQQSERYYDQAKRILGITDSYQGQYDSSAQSGKAKQMQIQQASGRLDSKRCMKNAAYAEIDQIIFQYYLAYADEPRPSAYKDAQGRIQNRIFNRYDFIERDEAGEYYYNDSYLFSCDASVDVEKQRASLWEENRKNFQEGAYGDATSLQTLLIFWQNMESAHYPWARDNVERIKEEIERQKEMEMLQQQNQQLQGQNQQLQQEVQNRQGYEAYLTEQAQGKKAAGSGNQTNTNTGV